MRILTPLIEDLLRMNEEGWNSFDRWTYKDGTQVYQELYDNSDPDDFGDFTESHWMQTFWFHHDDWTLTYNLVCSNINGEELHSEFHVDGNIGEVEHWFICTIGAEEVPEGD